MNECQSEETTKKEFANPNLIHILQADVTVESEVNSVCLLYTSPRPRDATLSRMPSSA